METRPNIYGLSNCSTYGSIGLGWPTLIGPVFIRVRKIITLDRSTYILRVGFDGLGYGQVSGFDNILPPLACFSKHNVQATGPLLIKCKCKCRLSHFSSPTSLPSLNALVKSRSFVAHSSFSQVEGMNFYSGAI